MGYTIAIICLVLISLIVGFIIGVVICADTEYQPKTNFDRYLEVNRDEIITDIASTHCINPVTYAHGLNDCEHCPFEHETGMVEYCIGNTEQWLRAPYQPRLLHTLKKGKRANGKNIQ